MCPICDFGLYDSLKKLSTILPILNRNKRENFYSLGQLVICKSSIKALFTRQVCNIFIIFTNVVLQITFPPFTEAEILGDICELFFGKASVVWILSIYKRCISYKW